MISFEIDEAGYQGKRYWLVLLVRRDGVLVKEGNVHFRDNIPGHGEQDRPVDSTTGKANYSVPVEKKAPWKIWAKFEDYERSFPIPAPV